MNAGQFVHKRLLALLELLEQSPFLLEERGVAVLEKQLLVLVRIAAGMTTAQKKNPMR